MRTNRAILLLLAASTIAPANWRQWRGPDENGTAPGDAPLAWTDSRNVAWKATIPGRGFSSPIVSGDKIFLTTAVLARRLVQREGVATEEGDTVVVKMGEKFEVLAVNTLTDQSFIASPAVAAGAISIDQLLGSDRLELKP